MPVTIDKHPAQSSDSEHRTPNVADPGRASRHNLAEHNAPASRPIKVLLADGHLLLAEALSHVLAADPMLHVVGVQTNPEAIGEHVRRTDPDLLLLSYFFMEHDDGRIARALRNQFPALPLLILTSSDDDQTIFSCVQHGAVGYVNKDRFTADLVGAIKRVSRGEVLFPSDVLVKLLTRASQEQATARPEPSVQPLAPREIELLQAVAGGLTTGEVAARMNITVHTVRTHLKHILTKLGARSKLEAVVTALRHGMIELPRPPST
jgi:DNA-binding NarL/FixJ family response regulator